VETGSTVAECEVNYRNELRNAGLIDDGEVEIVEPTTGSVSGVIEEIRTAVINGNSQYYISLQGDDHYYVVSAADDADAVILNAGDLVEIIYDTESAGTIVEAYGVELLQIAPESGPAPEEQMEISVFPVEPEEDVPQPTFLGEPA
jgi:hypothetical protein